MQKINKEKTPKQALTSLMRLCSRTEYSEWDARRLLRRWSVEENSHDDIIATLVKERYIDNNRYVEMFVRDKINLSGWGLQRVRRTLLQKGVPESLILGALKQFEEVDITSRVKRLLEKKIKSIKYKNTFDLRNKLLGVALRQGYEYSEVESVLNEMVHCEEE